MSEKRHSRLERYPFMNMFSRMWHCRQVMTLGPVGNAAIVGHYVHGHDKSVKSPGIFLFWGVFFSKFGHFEFRVFPMKHFRGSLNIGIPE